MAWQADLQFYIETWPGREVGHDKTTHSTRNTHSDGHCWENEIGSASRSSQSCCVTESHNKWTWMEIFLLISSFSLCLTFYILFSLYSLFPHWQTIIHDEQTKLRDRLGSIHDEAKESISQTMDKKSPTTITNVRTNMSQLELLNCYYQLSLK